MANWEDLKFDKMEVDTTLAQEYIKKNDNMFSSIVDGQRVLVDIYPDYKIEEYEVSFFYLEDKSFNTEPPLSQTIDSIALATKLRLLAKRVEMNKELFCQLEYMFRKKPADDVKKDLSLFINKCLHMSSMLEKYPSKNTGILDGSECFVLARSPLYYLFHAVSRLWPTGKVKIVATAETAAVCTLFIDLWTEIGFHISISMQIMRRTYIEPEITGPAEGCVGVVTETADLDSAVHAFVSSTTMNPWRLNSLLVQESVYEQFKRTLKWRCNVNSTNELREPHEPHLKEFSADTQVADGKIFLIDYVGTGHINSKLHPITISAYRTNKELIKIISQYEEPFISLWCSDSAYANEIAFCISSPCVWINSYAVFNGSPRVDSAVPYRRIEEGNSELKTDAAWLKLDVDKRRDVVRGVLQKLIDSNKNVSLEAVEILSGLSSRPGFIEVDECVMWIGVEKPLGTVYVGSESIKYLIDAVASIVYGNRLMISSELNRFSPIVDALQKEGVPVSFMDHTVQSMNSFKFYNTRVIYSSFGTIFAN